MGGFVRRNLLQLVGGVVMLAVVAAVGVVALRGDTSKVALSTAHATASPTADPEVAAVKAAVENFIRAEIQSGVTGDASVVKSLVIPDTQAASAAVAEATDSRQSHTTIISSRVLFSSWSVSVATPDAVVEVTVAVWGHQVSWPGLVPQGSEHQISNNPYSFTCQKVNGKWLISRFA